MSLLLICSKSFEPYIFSIRMISHRAILLLLVVMMGVSAEEWYEQGHQSLLDWSNFDSAVKQAGKFKFVKFYTRNCRYCRLLKQVEEQLRQEKQWSFEFYSVDCSVHYDLCLAKAAMTAFPFVGIYNTQGNMHGTIGGFYPLETMREAFTTIEDWQSQEIKKQSGVPTTVPDLKATQKEQPEGTETLNNKPAPVHPETTFADTKQKTQTSHKASNESKPKADNGDEDDEGWGRSIRDGIKLTVIFLGVIIFNKTVAPYLLPQPEQTSNYSQKTRTIEIPIQRPKVDLSKLDPLQSNHLLNDSL